MVNEFNFGKLLLVYCFVLRLCAKVKAIYFLRNELKLRPHESFIIVGQKTEQFG